MNIDPDETYSQLLTALRELDDLHGNLWADSETVGQLALAGERVYRLGSALSEWLGGGGRSPEAMDKGFG